MSGWKEEGLAIWLQNTGPTLAPVPQVHIDGSQCIMMGRDDQFASLVLDEDHGSVKGKH